MVLSEDNSVPSLCDGKADLYTESKEKSNMNGLAILCSLPICSVVPLVCMPLFVCVAHVQLICNHHLSCPQYVHEVETLPVHPGYISEPHLMANETGTNLLLGKQSQFGQAHATKKEQSSMHPTSHVIHYGFSENRYLLRDTRL